MEHLWVYENTVIKIFVIDLSFSIVTSSWKENFTKDEILSSINLSGDHYDLFYEFLKFFLTFMDI